MAACGGVVRNEAGEWVVGFKKKLGLYPVAIAEVVAIKVELEV